MSLNSALAAGRAAALRRMESRVTVRRPTGDMTTDSDGFEIPAWSDVYTDHPFRLDPGSSAGGSRGVTIGGVTFESATGVGRFPYASELLADGDLIEVTDGEWPGQVFQIVAAIKYDQMTDRRVPIVEHPRPEEWA